MTRREKMVKILSARFAPTHLIVHDDSAQHIGHAGARPEGQTHYTVEIAAPKFEGLSRLAAHRLIHEALEEEFETGLHALAIRLKTSH